MAHVMKSNYGSGPRTAGTTTRNAAARPARTQVPQYPNPDRIQMRQGTNHKGNK